MAEGCNLYISNSDYEHIRDSVHNHQERIQLDKSLQAAHESHLAEASPEVTAPLSNPDHPAHKILSEFVLRNVAGNESIPEQYKQELPSAVAKIAAQTPNVLGLIKPAINWGQVTSIDATGKLGHKTRGAGFAYELLGTAALITKTSKAPNSSKELRIYPADRVDLGIKFQSRYGSRTSAVFSQRRSIEADLLIYRQAAVRGWEPLEIAVDFKHARSGGVYSGGIEQSQLEKVRDEIQTGGIHEFHFVTNGTFPSGVINAIESMNAQLRQSGDAPISYHEHVRYGNM
jgi:hypothetical protein